jgi:hypothetical protein
VEKIKAKCLYLPKPKKEATVDILLLVKKGKMKQSPHKTAHL